MSGLNQFGRVTRCRSPKVEGIALVICLTWTSTTNAQILLSGPTVAQSTAASLSTASTDAYTLGPGDLLRVDILDVPEYSGEYLILSDGTLSLPLIGRFNVTGMTVAQLTNQITEKYIPYVQQPVTTVSLISPRPLSVVIAGEVTRPGSYVVPLLVPNSQTRQFQFYKVTQLLQQAGGVTQIADISNILIRRINPTEQVISVNLKELLEQGDIRQDVVLRDGDTIFVPRAEVLDPIAMRQLTSASFASERSQPFSVAVVGEVLNPGTHIVGLENGQQQEPPTVTEAIKVAGGITPLANVREIKLRRLTQDGQTEMIQINLWQLLQDGDVTQDIALQPGDSILIPQASAIDSAEISILAKASFSPDTIPINVVGEVIRPGVVDVSLDTTLNQAILAAGGFDERRADREAVELIRLNPNGTVSRQQIPIDLTSGIDPEINPVLQRDDIIIVSRSGQARFGDSVEQTLRPFGGFWE
ncbi:MAG: sugar transporter [Oscillatoriales cyanobacterium RM2_1_1]|nr:sugar transporter [Oscillatoriales cyanobacterium RM2_1_1]